MRHRLLRMIIAISTALLFGTYQNGALIEAGGGARFPLAWLQDTPFSDYTVPALILALGVGGNSLIATPSIFMGRTWDVLTACVAGLIMAGYIIAEVGLLRQGVSWIEGFYFGLGLLIFTLAATLRAIEH